jgi:myo-inositol-1(or 4)-monophosphatase
MPLLARFAMLASRELDAAISAPTKYDWDLAAGDLICREAGGEVTGTRGETMNYNQPARCQPGLVAASPARHKAILEILEQS